MIPDVPEPKLESLYQEVILDHNRKPRNYKEIPDAKHYAHGLNPLCGDDYHLYLVIDRDGIVQDVGFTGSGCAISKSSSSIMTTMIKGKKIEECQKLLKSFLEMMTQDNVSPAAKQTVGRLTLFEGVKQFPIRVKCATLIWHTLADALK